MTPKLLFLISISTAWLLAGWGAFAVLALRAKKRRAAVAARAKLELAVVPSKDEKTLATVAGAAYSSYARKACVEVRGSVGFQGFSLIHVSHGGETKLRTVEGARDARRIREQFPRALKELPQ